ncbi:MAG: hypothetical protein AB8B55_10970 [Mariniblastus sp.]
MIDPTKQNLAFKLALFLMLSLGMCTQAGCQIFGRFGGSSAKAIPVAYNAMPSQQQLLSNLRARSARVSQLSTSVRATFPGAPKIKGNLQIEFPERMRMKAGLMGVSEMGVDVGSNENQFWVWSKASLPGQPPALYYASHDAFQRSPIRQSIPLEPKWLVDSLGLFEFSPNDAHYGPMDAGSGRMRLYTVSQTPTGRQTRVTLLGAASGLIEQQSVYDAANRLIAYTNSSNYRNYAEQQISLPQRVELHMIQPDGQDVKIVVDFGTFAIGTPTSKVLHGNPKRMWAMPTPEGVPKIDLTRMAASQVSPNFNQRSPNFNQTSPGYNQSYNGQPTGAGAVGYGTTNQRTPNTTQPFTGTREPNTYAPAGWSKRSK